MNYLLSENAGSTNAILDESKRTLKTLTKKRIDYLPNRRISTDLLIELNKDYDEFHQKTS